MDEQLKAKFLGYLDGLEKAAGKLGDAASVEIPETVKEWLMWQSVEYGIMGWAVVVGAVIVLAMFRVFARAAAECGCNGENAPGPGAYRVMGWLVFAFLLLVPGTNCLIHAIKPLVAPRVVIVEQLAKFVKK